MAVQSSPELVVRGDTDRSGHSESHDGENRGVWAHVDRLDFAKRELLREPRAERSLRFVRYAPGHGEADRMLRRRL